MSKNKTPRHFIVEDQPKKSQQEVKIIFQGHDGHTRVLKCRYTALQFASSLAIDFESVVKRTEILS